MITHLPMAERRKQEPKRRRSWLDDEEIRERMSGNLCRCAAYANIVSANSAVASDVVEGGSRR
jgi:aerobic-type carbon monoxide dehydrogenase small subunit (CoxS/CutS family)